MTDVSFTLNGQPTQVAVEPKESLLHALRGQCGIKSTKNGCEPQGQCGCCLAIVGGNPKVTCAMPAKKAEGKEILTLEGIPADERDMYPYDVRASQVRWTWRARIAVYAVARGVVTSGWTRDPG